MEDSTIDSNHLNKVQLTPSWLEPLSDEFSLPYMRSLKAFLQDQKQKGRTIYPKGDEIFQALNSTPLKEIKAVILGQDPYHGPDQAHGLSFSVKTGTKLPPSLVNIFKELSNDLHIDNFSHGQPTNGCLSTWAKQGVLLLNSVLTVEKGLAGSHQGKGWEAFTDKIINVINTQREHVVFLLWGSHAQKKGHHINEKKHLILKAPHPSPLSAHRGYFGCKHFSKTNQYLIEKGKAPINWQI